ncbi:hypothetical protein SBA4_3010012 [Candidatus Sulfopaludibacter sp. SbA4]|nr:hypothetical protein SBA4_3010012 [Candidatus Sulfopaludibacter sp. SbA4]
MSYLHHIPGRIRVRVAGVKHNPARASALKEWLQSLKGVERVDVNTLTGSVLIHYSATVTCGDRLIARMREREGISAGNAEPAPARRTPRGLKPAPRRLGIERVVARAILGCLAEAAIERSLMAIAAAVL